MSIRYSEGGAAAFTIMLEQAQLCVSMKNCEYWHNTNYPLLTQQGNLRSVQLKL